MSKPSAALDLHNMNYNVLLTLQGTKRPFSDWKALQIERLTKAQIARLFNGRDWEVAILCGELKETGVNVVGLDFDSLDDFNIWLKGPVPAHDLPLLPVELLNTAMIAVTANISITSNEKSAANIYANADRLHTISRAMKYAAAMDPAVSGQRGHSTLFRFACKMVRQPPHGFGLLVEEAWPIALLFNQRCLPPFVEAEVHRKMIEAKKKDS